MRSRVEAGEAVRAGGATSLPWGMQFPKLAETPGLHLPAWHTRFLLQTVPQAPQLLGSVCRSWQVPEQAVWPAGHASAHAPLTQL